MNEKITARKIVGFKPSVLNNCVCHNEINKLEKAYEEIERWHFYSNQEGFVYEEEILYLDYVKKHINNLQSKIDKAIEYIINHSEEYKPHFRKIELDTVQCNELLNILEEE